jgi:hypothetical protein
MNKKNEKTLSAGEILTTGSPSSLVLHDFKPPSVDDVVDDGIDERVCVVTILSLQ